MSKALLTMMTTVMTIAMMIRKGRTNFNLTEFQNGLDIESLKSRVRNLSKISKHKPNSGSSPNKYQIESTANLCP